MELALNPIKIIGIYQNICAIIVPIYLANNSTRYNPFWTGEVLHGGIKCQVMALSSLLYVISCSFYSHMYTFKEGSRVVGFHMALQKTFNISCPFLYSLLYPALPFLS